MFLLAKSQSIDRQSLLRFQFLPVVKIDYYRRSVTDVVITANAGGVGVGPVLAPTLRGGAAQGHVGHHHACDSPCTWPLHACISELCM